MTGRKTSTCAGAVMSIQILIELPSPAADRRRHASAAHYMARNGVDTLGSVSRPLRTPGLDGLRGVAALSVVCLHVWLYTRGDPARPDGAGFWGHAAFQLRLGLIFFFVLSGYLLFGVFARG